MVGSRASWRRRHSGWRSCWPSGSRSSRASPPPRGAPPAPRAPPGATSCDDSQRVSLPSRRGGGRGPRRGRPCLAPRRRHYSSRVRLRPRRRRCTLPLGWALQRPPQPRWGVSPSRASSRHPPDAPPRADSRRCSVRPSSSITRGGRGSRSSSSTSGAGPRRWPSVPSSNAPSVMPSRQRRGETAPAETAPASLRPTSRHPWARLVARARKRPLALIQARGRAPRIGTHCHPSRRRPSRHAATGSARRAASRPAAVARRWARRAPLRPRRVGLPRPARFALRRIDHRAHHAEAAQPARAEPWLRLLDGGECAE